MARNRSLFSRGACVRCGLILPEAEGRWLFEHRYVCRDCAEAYWVETQSAPQVQQDLERDRLSLPLPELIARYPSLCGHYRRGPIQPDDSQECLDCHVVFVSDG
jgi:hypothetical protein